MEIVVPMACGVIGAWLGGIGVSGHILFALLAANLLDYATGVFAAAKHNKISSAVGLRGIYKKLGIWAGVLVAFIADYILHYGGASIGITVTNGALLTPTVTLWFVANELISVLENLAKAGVRLPGFLLRALEGAVGNIEPMGKDEKKGK